MSTRYWEDVMTKELRWAAVGFAGLVLFGLAAGAMMDRTARIPGNCAGASFQMSAAGLDLRSSFNWGRCPQP
jgi:hypothetical protein